MGKKIMSDQKSAVRPQKVSRTTEAPKTRDVFAKMDLTKVQQRPKPAKASTGIGEI